MSSPPNALESKRRRAVFDTLAVASVSGSLGLFVGTGMSIAATDGAAPRWMELLARVAGKLGISAAYDAAACPGTAPPGVASRMVEALAGGARAMDNARRADATRRLKLAITREVDLSATPAMGDRLRPALATIAPAWCVTTNYDFVLEGLLPHAECLLAEQIVRARPGCTPVVHLHGHRYAADSIVVTEEDYVRLVHAPEYRQMKLALLFAESTVVTLGYGLGDVNVRAAIAWGRSFRPRAAELRAPEQGRLVLVDRTRDVEGDGVRFGPDDEVIVQSTEIASFLEELAAARRLVDERHAAHRALLVEAVESRRLDGRPFDDVFLDQITIRRSFLRALRSIPASAPSAEIAARIDDALKAAAKRARSSGAADDYDRWLRALLDVLEEWPIGQMPPALMQRLARQLAAIAPHLVDDPKRPGRAVPVARRTWQRRRSLFERHPLLLEALHDFAEQKDERAMRTLLPPRAAGPHLRIRG